MNFVIGYLVISIVCVIVLYILACMAPYGYQDENRFHFGVPNRDTR